MDCDSFNVIVSLAAKIITTVGGLLAAFWAIYVYNRNSRVRHAEWLLSLYEKFYESELREIREILDCVNGDSDHVTEVVSGERRDFTDYLNFLEFVAVLQKSNQLIDGEVEDLFCYYLDCLQKCRDVRNYIADKTNGYEQLGRLLRERVSNQ